MNVKNTQDIEIHISAGVFYGALAGLIQGLIEAFIWSIRYGGYILSPESVFKSQIFVVISKLFGIDRSEATPFILDSYLGPGFLDKLPLIYNLAAVYAVAGLLMGAFLGVLVWCAFRSTGRALNSEKLNALYLGLVLGLGLPFNLLIWLDKKGTITTFSIMGVLIYSGFIACAFALSLLVYKSVWASRGKPLEGDDRVSSRALIRRGKTAVLSVALIVCAGLALNLWVFGKDKAAPETFAAEDGYSGGSKSSSINDKDVNIILISVDSLRADHLNCYGYGRKTSPNIDGLAAEGVLFSDASSVTSWTLPAHLSMLTSMYPEAHGVVTDKYSLDDNRTTLPEILKDEGYITAGFISGAYLHSRYGFEQGFVFYDDFTIGEAAEAGEAVRVVSSPRLNESVQNWLGKNYDRKFFLFLHYFDVHFDYIPPPPYDTMFDPDYEGIINGKDFFVNPGINPEMSPRDLSHIIALYDGEIAFTDKYIGEVLSALKKFGVYDRTLIILTADHGDEFFEHGGKGHKRTLYEEVLHVPLIFKFPSDFDLYGVKKVGGAASVIDIAPTVFDYIGVEPNDEMQGKSLLPLLDENEKTDDFLVYAGLEYKLAAVKSANSKLIHHLRAPEKEFYDLANDPEEKTNLLDKEAVEDIPEGKKHLFSLLGWLNAQKQFYGVLAKSEGKKEIELSESAKEELKSLGYIQ